MASFSTQIMTTGILISNKNGEFISSKQWIYFIPQNYYFIRLNNALISYPQIMTLLFKTMALFHNKLWLYFFQTIAILPTPILLV